MIAVLIALAAAAPPPTYLVERVVTTTAAVRRLSVFDNRAVALSVRPPGGVGTVRRSTLGDVEWQVLVQVVEESYRELDRSPWQGQAPGSANLELRLAPLGRKAMTVRLPLTAVPSLAVSRLGQALDGLEQRLGDEPEPREDLSAWQPAIGERIQLDDGRIATVEEIHDQSGTTVLRVRFDEGPGTAFYALDELRARAVRRVRP